MGAGFKSGGLPEWAFTPEDTRKPGENTFTKLLFRDSLGGPEVRTLPSNAGGAGSIPGQGAKMPHGQRHHKTRT